MDYSLLLLGVLSLFNGVASAALTISSYVIILPVLVVGFEFQVTQALFVCFMVDCLNGVLVCIRYRHKLCDKTIRPTIMAVIVTSVTASSVAAAFGIEFLRHHEEGMKQGLSVFDFLMGAGFIFKFRKQREVELAEEEREGNEYELMESQDSEISFPLPLDELNSTSPMENTKWEKVLQRNVCFDLDVRTVVTLVVLLSISGMAGVIGFGGGNAFAIYFMIMYKWSTIRATAASGAISGAMTFALMMIYLKRDVANIDNMGHHLAIILPCDLVAVLFFSQHAKDFKESTLCLLVGILFILIGAFVTTYTLASS